MILMTARNAWMFHARVEMCMIMTKLIIVNNLKICKGHALDKIIEKWI